MCYIDIDFHCMWFWELKTLICWAFFLRIYGFLELYFWEVTGFINCLFKNLKLLLYFLKNLMLLSIVRLILKSILQVFFLECIAFISRSLYTLNIPLNVLLRIKSFHHVCFLKPMSFISWPLHNLKHFLSCIFDN